MSFACVVGVSLRSGDALRARHPNNAIVTSTGRRSTYRRRNAVQRNPTTSETYVKVRGQWAYLYRAVDKHGNTIDFYLSPTRNTAAAKRFLRKAMNALKDWEKPTVINTDKAPTYAALVELKKKGKCPEATLHR